MRYIFFRSAEVADTEAQKRIREVIQQNQLDDAPELQEEDKEKDNKQLPFVDRLAWSLSHSSTLQDEDGKNFMSRLELQLIRAGIRNKYSPEQALATAVLIWFVGFVIATVVFYSNILPSFFAIIILAVTVYYPFAKLKDLIIQRQSKIASEVPLFIQQIYMALSSGNTNIDGAIERIAADNEKDNYESLLAKEFSQAQIEYSLGAKETETAIRDIGYRTGIISVENLCEALIQGIRTGTPLTEVLLSYSSQAQEMWKQDIREFKNRKEPMYTIGVVTTMFGAFTIMIAPFFIGLTNSFTSF